MHAETESTVRALVPGLLDAAGMTAEAEEMRRIDMFSETCVNDCVTLLRKASEEATGPWADLLKEVCFWAEAMLWMAWGQDSDLFYECQRQLEDIVSDGLPVTVLH